ncbi:MAG: glycine zipper 2TM domain-containing protein [Aquabacterium sp.]|nr:MAG: glycine zipper 2TM domain-containing protein [Aquabacterium sp.]
MSISNQTSSVDLALPMEGGAAAATAPVAAAAGGTPQALWAVAGAGLALVVGLAATAAVSDHRAGTDTGPVATQPAQAPAHGDARTDARRNSRQAERVALAQPSAGPAAAVCATCGVVESVRPVKVRGRANGTGAVIGGVAGGVIGHEVGGNAAGTVIGAVGGGLLGHHIEKEARSHTVYKTQVRMDDGSLRTFTEGSSRAVGSKVVIENGKLK